MARLLQIAQIGHPVLRQRAEPIDRIDATVHELIDDLFATSQEANGAGIAAPQIYVSLRAFILSIRPSPRYPNAPSLPPTAVINPEILWASDAMETDWEGCLSVPGMRGRVPRPAAIRVRYTTLTGEQQDCEFEGFSARVFLHENDHLDGTLWLDRIADNRDIYSEKEYLRSISIGN